MKRFLLEFFSALFIIALIGFVMNLIKISFFVDGTFGGY